MTENSSFEADLILFRELNTSINRRLSIKEEEINRLLVKVKTEGDLACNEKINRLYEIQDMLAVAYYKYEFPINDRLLNFIHDFDRKDEYAKSFMIKKIKKGYTL